MAFWPLWGEEFAVLLADISSQEAEAFAEQLCEVIRQLNLEHANRGMTRPGSVSVLGQRLWTLSISIKC